MEVLYQLSYPGAGVTIAPGKSGGRDAEMRRTVLGVAPRAAALPVIGRRDLHLGPRQIVMGETGFEPV
jgi:hypothetical protein